MQRSAWLARAKCLGTVLISASPLAWNRSVCYVFVIVDLSKANTWKCLWGKHISSNTLKAWRDLAIISAAQDRLFDACLVRPPLQTNTKAVPLVKKGQANNVLPSCKLNEPSMLRLQMLFQSTFLEKERKPQAWEAFKTSARRFKVGVFWHFLAVRTHAVTFFFLRQTCSCRFSSRCRAIWHLITWC